MTDNTFRLFWPKDIGPYESDLKELALALRQSNDHQQQLDRVHDHLQNLSVYPNSPEARLRYRAFLLVCVDLLRQQWQPKIQQGKIYLQPPDWTSEVKTREEIEKRKRALRQALMWERKAQFEKRSVQEFVRSMEQERLFQGSVVSIRSLFADGRALARELRDIVELQDKAKQAERALSVIQPYLQLITTDARCAYTGLRLQDIWRYFRYTWSTPYNPTPGRQMFYLVRDAARQYHPIVGIAALGSSLVQLTTRDDKIGWTPRALERRLHSPTFNDDEADHLFRVLKGTLLDTLNDLYTDDLVSPAELSRPQFETFERLARLEQESRQRRVDLLQQRHQHSPGQHPMQLSLNATMDRERGDPSSDLAKLSDLALDALYRAKRANVLRRLLEAKRALAETKQSLRTADGLRAFWRTNAGGQAIRTLLRENKKRRVGINMMDIIVCGAIPPYNFILGGKLVAMLLTSPQVVHECEEKYAGYASTIASRMKGQDVLRDSRLVFLGTTSLYSTGSSQYNRITIPIPGENDETLIYDEFGKTEGYGSIHFSEETVDALTELQELTSGARLINNRFGEGVNPKMRRLRSGLAAIGLSPVDDYIRHRLQRIVYGVPLGRASYAFLRGETNDPDYYFPASSETERETATQYISSYWATRWLMSRIQRSRYIDEVATFQCEEVLLSNEICSSRQQMIQIALNL